MIGLTAKMHFITFLLLPSLISIISFALYVNDVFDYSYYGSISGILFYVQFIYAIRPKFVNIDKLYGISYDNLVIEFNLLKRFLFFIIPISIILYFTISYFISVSPQTPIMSNFQGFNTLPLLGLSSFSFIRILILTTKEDFKFYYSKGCCIIISGKEDEFERMKYLLQLLRSYNKYLQQKIKIEINNIKKLYSIILYKGKEERNQIIESICESLENDKFSLAEYLTSIHTIPDSEFYVKTSIFGGLKLIGAIVAGAIPIIISIITLINDILNSMIS